MAFMKLGELLSVPQDNPELIRSQLAALSSQVPLLLVVLIINTAAVAATHFSAAPIWLTAVLPAPVLGLCLYWLATWRRLGKCAASLQRSVARLQSAVYFAGVLGVGFTAWGISLYPYGDAYQQAHVAFYISITVIACIFCLMHLRAAAVLLTLVVLIPFTAFFAATGKPVMIAMAVNVGLVALAMMYILSTHYRDFANLIDTQKQLIARQRQTQELSDENYRLSNLDVLTGLPNRRSFFRDFDNQLALASAANTAFAVALIDLDGFKTVNDLHGHAAGDRLLVETARRLQDIIQPGMIMARLGGDEFVLLIAGEHDRKSLLALGKAVCETLRLTYDLNDAEVTISGSVGLVIYPAAGETRETLFEHADYALMHAKHNRRGSAVIFAPEHETEIRLLNRIDQALRHADLNLEMTIALQPIIDITVARTVGYEVLSRWSSPLLGDVEPAVFIRAAERSELINRMTEGLLRKTLGEMPDWPADTHISINLSARDIASPETVLRLVAILSHSGIAASRITFEITETAVMADFDQAGDVLRMLRRLGARVALDDFGSGYSSLGYVHRLPLDRIKIDRVFVADIETSTASRSIVKTIVGLCQNLELECVVEGVETEGQMAALRALGCTLMQGYYFARPQSPAELWPKAAARA